MTKTTKTTKAGKAGKAGKGGKAKTITTALAKHVEAAEARRAQCDDIKARAGRDIRISDDVLIMLNKASEHEDGCLTPPAGYTETRLRQIARYLAERKLAALMYATTSAAIQPTWCRDHRRERDQVLRITRAGLTLLGLADPTDTPAPAPAPQPQPAPRQADAEANAATKPAPRAGTKMEAALELMRRPAGASIPEMQAATSWQPHTLRALISATLRKQRGIAIERRRENGESRYHAA